MPLAGLNLSDPPKNSRRKSLTATFELPRHAAKKLHDLAISGDKRLKEIGILKVQIRELTEEWRRHKQSSDSAGVAGFQKNQSLIAGPPVVTLNTVHPFPWQHQQPHLHFTYYTSTQPTQQLVRDRADVRLYSLPTNDKGDHHTKIIGISRGVLTDESIPVDSSSQQSVPSWLIESSLCISFRRHGKCDVACQTGSERILYRSRPSSFRYEAPVKPPGPTPGGVLMENNARYKIYGNKEVSAYQLNSEKSPSAMTIGQGQCSSESIRILESLANSIITAEERTGEALSGAYPVSKKNQEEVRDQAKSIVRSDSNASTLPERGFSVLKHSYPSLTEHYDILQNGLNRVHNPREFLYSKPSDVSRGETIWSRGTPEVNRNIVEESHIRNLGKENGLVRQEIMKVDARTPQENVATGGHNLERKFSSDKFSVQTEKERKHSSSVIVQERGSSKESLILNVTEKKIEKQQERLVGVKVELEKEQKQSLVGKQDNNNNTNNDDNEMSVDQVTTQMVEHRLVKEARTSSDSEAKKSSKNEAVDDKSKTEAKERKDIVTKAQSVTVPTDNSGSALSGYSFEGGSLPISVMLDSDYLRGISARGSEGRYKRPVVKEETLGKGSVNLEAGASDIVSADTQARMKRKRGRSAKSDVGFAQMLPSEAAKKKRGRPCKTKGTSASTVDPHSEEPGTDLVSQTLEAKGSPKLLFDEDVKPKMDNKKEVICVQGVTKDEAGTTTDSPGMELQQQQRQETPKSSCMDAKVSGDSILPREEITQMGDMTVCDNEGLCVEQNKADMCDSAGNEESCPRSVKSSAKSTSKVNSKRRPSTPNDVSALPSPVPATSSSHLRRQVSSPASRPASPSDTDIKVRSRSHRCYPKDTIHREIEELYLRTCPSMACETEQLLPDDIYYGENYPIVFADDDEIAMKFVDMSTAFKLAMKDKLATNYSSRDEKRGIKPVPKAKPQHDMLKKDTNLYEKMLRKRASAEKRAARMNESKRRNTDYSGDIEFVADRSSRRSTEEEELQVKPSHQMSLRPRRTKTIEDDYLSSDSLEDNDTEPDTGSLYESDESSDSEPLINKVKNAGKAREKFSMQLTAAPQQSISSEDDDTDGGRKSLYFTGAPATGVELKRSESVSTNESDTFDLIPSRKMNPPGPRSVVREDVNASELKMETKVTTATYTLGDQGETSRDTSSKDSVQHTMYSFLNKSFSDSQSTPAALEENPSGHEIEDGGCIADVETTTKTKLDATVIEELSCGASHREKAALHSEVVQEDEVQNVSISSKSTVEDSKGGTLIIEGKKGEAPIGHDGSMEESLGSVTEQIVIDCGDVSSESGHVSPESGHVSCVNGHVLPDSGHVLSGSDHMSGKKVDIIQEAGESLSIVEHETTDSRDTKVDKGHVASQLRDGEDGEHVTRQEDAYALKQSERIDEYRSDQSSISRPIGAGLIVKEKDVVEHCQKLSTDSQSAAAFIHKSYEGTDGSDEQAASSGETLEGGSRITRLIKRTIQKISDSLERGKEKLTCKRQEPALVPMVEGDAKTCATEGDKVGQGGNGVVQSELGKPGEDNLPSCSSEAANGSIGLGCNVVSQGDGGAREAVKSDRRADDVESDAVHVGEKIGLRNEEDRKKGFLTDVVKVAVEKLDLTLNKEILIGETARKNIEFESCDSDDDDDVANNNNNNGDCDNDDDDDDVDGSQVCVADNAKDTIDVSGMDLLGEDGQSISEGISKGSYIHDNVSAQNEPTVQVSECGKDDPSFSNSQSTASASIRQAVSQESALDPFMSLPVRTDSGVVKEDNCITGSSESSVENDSKAHAEGTLNTVVIFNREDTGGISQEDNVASDERSTVSQSSDHALEDRSIFTSKLSSSRVEHIEKGLLSEEKGNAESSSIPNEMPGVDESFVGESGELVTALKDKGDGLHAISVQNIPGDLLSKVAIEGDKSLHDVTESLHDVTESTSVESQSSSVIHGCNVHKDSSQTHDKFVPVSNKSPRQDVETNSDELQRLDLVLDAGGLEVETSGAVIDSSEQDSDRLANVGTRETMPESRSESEKREKVSSVNKEENCVGVENSQEASLRKEEDKLEGENHSISSSCRSEGCGKGDLVEVQTECSELKEDLLMARRDDLSVSDGADQRTEVDGEMAIERQQEGGPEIAGILEDEMVEINMQEENTDKENVNIDVTKEDVKKENVRKEDADKEVGDKEDVKKEDVTVMGENLRWEIKSRSGVSEEKCEKVKEKKTVENEREKGNEKMGEELEWARDEETNKGNACDREIFEEICGGSDRSEKVGSDTGTEKHEDKTIKRNKEGKEEKSMKQQEEETHEGNDGRDKKTCGKKNLVRGKESVEGRSFVGDVTTEKGRETELNTNRQPEPDMEGMPVNELLVPDELEGTGLNVETGKEIYAEDSCNIKDCRSSDQALESSAEPRTTAEEMNAKVQLVVKERAAVELVSPQGTTMDISVKSKGTSKRQSLEDETGASVSKIMKLDTAEGVSCVPPREIDLSSENRKSSSAGDIGKGENAEDCKNVKPSRERLSDCVDFYLKAGENTQDKLCKGMETGAAPVTVKPPADVKTKFFDSSVGSSTSGVDEEADHTMNTQQKASSQNLDENDIEQHSTKRNESFSFRPKLDEDCVSAGITENRIISGKSDCSRGSREEVMEKEVGREGRIELTDALQRIQQYEESSDEESIANVSVDGESCEGVKGCESVKGCDSRNEHKGESHTTQSAGAMKGDDDDSTGIEQVEQSANQLSTDFSREGSSFVRRIRRYSTTESDSRQRRDRPKRRKSAADSDAMDGNHVVLTRRMRRETGSPAKRLRSSRP